MAEGPPTITVCICTFRRPALLKRLLEKLPGQLCPGAFDLSIVVADNDAERTAEGVCSEFAGRSSIPTRYCCEPRQNIALARNQAIAMATGDFIAFIDDDEFPATGWLAELVRACERFQASGVLGPVRPHFEEPPPAWIIKGRFCERPEYPTGTVMGWNECRTGNLLFRRSILSDGEDPFKEEFGTGGEDKDFFMRMEQRHCVFVWCNEAITYETVPPLRWKRSYMLHRALLRGRNILKHPAGRARVVLTSLLAVPLYSLVLPITLFGGQHRFMTYCIKLCDHFGRLLALVGLNRISRRRM